MNLIYQIIPILSTFYFPLSTNQCISLVKCRLLKSLTTVTFYVIYIFSIVPLHNQHSFSSNHSHTFLKPDNAILTQYTAAHNLSLCHNCQLYGTALLSFTPHTMMISKVDVCPLLQQQYRQQHANDMLYFSADIRVIYRQPV